MYKSLAKHCFKVAVLLGVVPVKKFVPVLVMSSKFSVASSFSPLFSDILRVQFITFIRTLFSPEHSEDEPEGQLEKYWLKKNVDEIVEEADRLYKNRKFLEVYELLNRLKYSNNTEVQWRIGRALFKMSCQDTLGQGIRREMIQEAYEILMASFPAGENSPKVHKWAAIITDRKNGMEGIEQRVKNSHKVKEHLVKCCELDPSDVAAQYLLGRWCYEMSNITWFQRLIAKILYGSVPEATLEEAYKYLCRAEDLQPRFFLQNTYLLGKTCMKLGRYYWAKYYFGVVAHLPASNENDKKCALDAKKMVRKLDKYGLETRVLFYEYPFGNNE